jgi:hypothetical protein
MCATAPPNRTPSPTPSRSWSSTWRSSLAVGSGPHYRVECDRHFAKLKAVLAGDTSICKGTSVGRVREIFKIADEEWDVKKRTVLG